MNLFSKLCVLIAVFAGSYCWSEDSAPTGESSKAAVDEASDRDGASNLPALIKKAREEEKAALGSHDVKKLEAAHEAVQKVRNVAVQYEKQRKTDGLSDDAIEKELMDMGLGDTLSVDRAIRAELEVLNHK